MKQTFEEADKNGDGLLNIEEIHQLMHKLNVNLPRRKVRQMFQVGASSTGFHCAKTVPVAVCFCTEPQQGLKAGT